MKKFLSVLCVSLFVLLMFGTPGNSVKAAGNSANSVVPATLDCGCNVTPLVGTEKYKIIASIVLSEEFVKMLMDANKNGYKWDKSEDIQVIKNNKTGDILVGFPFVKKGIVEMFAFLDGKYVGHHPLY
ncbi:hypothetical protein [Neobacillus ginsengisoli]|uniref:Uncharacterized protein n=1 Tax=Neobacillus ginsengisoli TaxID=904295 RepID=A0ABT9Y169_9BACI|nr:hypothetical protein [Neobacillus ginsengisoli]MDQ0201346.1 hypothetical protein [Neobacillus ginsengisoli]